MNLFKQVARPNAALIVAILASSLGFMDGTVLSVAISAIRADLGASFDAVQWVALGYTLVLTSFILIGGAAGDLFGVRKLLNGGLIVFTLASLACGVAGSIEALIIARIVQGFGAALMVPASLALIAKNYAPDVRGRAIGTWAAAAAVSGALGPVLGGLLLDHFGWRPVFFINLPLAALTLLISLTLVPADQPSADNTKLDWPGAVLAALGLGGMTLGLTMAGAQSSVIVGAPLTWFSAGAVVFAGFLLWQMRARSPMMPLQLFANRTFAGANVLTFFLYAALSGVMFYLPMVLISGVGASATQSGAVFLPLTAMLAILSPLSGKWSDTAGARWPLIVGSAIIALGFVGVALAFGGSNPWQALIIAMVVIGIGLGIAVAPLSTLVMQAAGPEQSGTASGINNAVSRFAGLFAVAGFGQIGQRAFVHYLAGGNQQLPLPPGLSFGALPDGANAALQGIVASANRSAFVVLASTAALCALLAALTGFLAVSKKGSHKRLMHPQIPGILDP